MAEITNRPIPRMRTAAKVVSEIKALDPDSEITEYWVRQLIKSGTIPVVRAGCKALVNLDDVVELLSAGVTLMKPEPCTAGGIRRIDPKLKY